MDWYATNNVFGYYFLMLQPMKEFIRLYTKRYKLLFYLRWWWYEHITNVSMISRNSHVIIMIFPLNISLSKLKNNIVFSFSYRVHSERQWFHIFIRFILYEDVYIFITAPLPYLLYFKIFKFPFFDLFSHTRISRSAYTTTMKRENQLRQIVFVHIWLLSMQNRWARRKGKFVTGSSFMITSFEYQYWDAKQQ